MHLYYKYFAYQLDDGMIILYIKHRVGGITIN